MKQLFTNALEGAAAGEARGVSSSPLLISPRIPPTRMCLAVLHLAFGKIACKKTRPEPSPSQRPQSAAAQCSVPAKAAVPTPGNRLDSARLFGSVRVGRDWRSRPYCSTTWLDVCRRTGHGGLIIHYVPDTSHCTWTEDTGLWTWNSRL